MLGTGLTSMSPNGTRQLLWRRRLALTLCWLGVLAATALLLPAHSVAQTELAETSQEFESPPLFDAILHWTSIAFEGAGVIIIALSAVMATATFIYGRLRRAGIAGSYHRYRADLGRGILLGLELLVAADIIGTVAVEPTFTNLGVLAVIVLIRTFLSFSLSLEINGRWPWQQEPKHNNTSKEAF